MAEDDHGFWPPIRNAACTAYCAAPMQLAGHSLLIDQSRSSFLKLHGAVSVGCDEIGEADVAHFSGRSEPSKSVTCFPDWLASACTSLWILALLDHDLRHLFSVIHSSTNKFLAIDLNHMLSFP